MNGLTRYMFWQLFVGMTLVASALACVVWLTQSLRFVNLIVNSGLSASTFVYLTGLMMPNFLTIILPVSLFAITTFSYHRMIMDRELVVMRSAGLGQLALAKPAIILGMIMVGIGYLLSIYIVPTSYAEFRSLKWDARYNFSHILLKEGTFNDISRGVTVYVRERTDDGQLLGIMAHIERDNFKSETWLAERGALVENEDGGRVLMFNGSRQEFTNESKQLTILYFDQSVLDLDPPTEEGNVRHREPRERTLAELHDLDTTGLDLRSIGKYKVEIHRRLALPLSALGFVMIALSVLISGAFTRRGEGRRVFVAVVLAAVYQGSMLAVINAAAKNEALYGTIYAVALLPVAVGMIVLLTPGKFTGLINKRQPAPPHSGQAA
ncbi:LPS export ABC transporter permease LptF [Magnetovibrio sp. PR-2]|uniref:LPS export ABC transporter permease LptF n=1 Tax=Magnetovibrio sp. PR-2 TaxID=3120356 RepID=UPI002FCDF68E